jgi:predicted phage terminase large subunit-like protein
MSRNGDSIPSLIDFWRLKRKYGGDLCEVRPFHELIADKLTNLIVGKATKPNLMILMPPRCAKTDLGVKAFVPWGLSRFPDSEWILSSYGQDLATANSVDIRNALASDWYRSTIDSRFWGAHVAMRGEGAGGRQDYFYTDEGGSVKAVGTGGGITGFGAGKLRSEFGGAILIDDPLKAQEARSAAVRKAACAYIDTALKSRRNRQEDPATPIVLIMQRLHPQDPAGYLLQTEREKWDVLQIPAHEGEEVIWPGRLDYRQLMELKESNPDEYWAQYMQSPSDSMTSIYKRSWWRYWQDIQKVEARLTLKFLTADTAFKEKDSADWSVLQCWGVEGISGIYLIDQIRERCEFPELLTRAKQFWEKHTARTSSKMTPATEFWIEDAASGISLVQTLRRERGIPARPWTPTEKTGKDKVARANQVTMSISAGRVFLPDPKMPGYKWVEGFLNEHEAFAADMSHTWDDQCDAQTEALLIWQERGGGRGPVPNEF